MITAGDNWVTDSTTVITHEQEAELRLAPRVCTLILWIDELPCDGDIYLGPPAPGGVPCIRCPVHGSVEFQDTEVRDAK